MAEEFVLQIRVAANALMTAKTCIDENGPVLRLSWQNKDVCLATEALWSMYATSLPQGVTCRLEQDDDGFVVIPAKRCNAPLSRNVSLRDFPGSISRLMAFARSGWKLMDTSMVLAWPFYSGTDKNQQTARLPLWLGRKTLQKHGKTHVLFTHRAPAASRFDVFMRLMAKSFDLPAEPVIWFGRVQFDLFYALVHHTHGNAFVRMVNWPR